jgi:hypothetical protein
MDQQAARCRSTLDDLIDERSSHWWHERGIQVTQGHERASILLHHQKECQLEEHQRELVSYHPRRDGEECGLTPKWPTDGELQVAYQGSVQLRQGWFRVTRILRWAVIFIGHFPLDNANKAKNRASRGTQVAKTTQDLQHIENWECWLKEEHQWEHAQSEQL